MALRPHEAHALKFLLSHLGIGVLGGALVGGLLLHFDSYGLWTMIRSSGNTILATFMLFFGLFITFGGVGMAIGVMGLGDHRDRDPDDPYDR